MASGKTKVSFAQLFMPKPNVGSLTPLTGLRLPGIWRRPVVNDDVLCQMAAIVRAVFAATPTRALFGKSVKWTPSSTSACHGFEHGIDSSGIVIGTDVTYTRCGPCARGHTSTGNSEGGVPFWPIMPSPSPWHDVAAGATLCFACYQKTSILSKRRLWLKPVATDAPT